MPLPDPQARRSVLEIQLIKRGHSLEFDLDRLVAVTEGLQRTTLSTLAALAVEKMLADSNPDVPAIAGAGRRGDQGVPHPHAPIRWSDVEPGMRRTKPETSLESVRRFESW